MKNSFMDFVCITLISEAHGLLSPQSPCGVSYCPGSLSLCLTVSHCTVIHRSVWQLNRVHSQCGEAFRTVHRYFKPSPSLFISECGYEMLGSLIRELPVPEYKVICSEGDIVMKVNGLSLLYPIDRHLKFLRVTRSDCQSKKKTNIKIHTWIIK